MKKIFLFLIITSYLAGNVLFAAEAERLGWVVAPQNKQYVCGGYYQDPLAALIGKTLPALTTTPIKIEAGPAAFQKGGTSVLSGGVTVEQPGRWMHADRAELQQDPATGKLHSATLTGNVILREPGKVILGESAHVELGARIGNFVRALYRMAVTAMTGADQQQNLDAWGKAETAEQQASGITTLRQATYTTCAPTTNTWQVTAARIDLDRDKGRGYAHHAWLKVKDVPVFYTPYFNFPIDDRRQSGFLFPSMGTSSNSGTNINIPYYWNIAPNYDAIITPRYYSKRGLQLGGLFRYLTTVNEGSVNLGFLPHDSAFSDFKTQSITRYPDGPLKNQLLDSSNTRYFVAWKNNTNFNSRWKGEINYNRVSDSYYYQDFRNPSTPVPNQLPQQGDIKYSGDNWNFTGLVQTFQTLHTINQVVINNPYSRLPELDLNGNFPNQAHGLAYQVNSQFVYFDRAHNPGEKIPVSNSGPPNAGRFHLQPGAMLPLTSLSGYLTPRYSLPLRIIMSATKCQGFHVKFNVLCQFFR